MEEHPDHEELRISDAYQVKEKDVALELVADVLNINAGHNEKLLRACKTLGDYAEYVRRIREYAKEVPIEKAVEAVERAIQECIREDILREFLKKNRSEAKAMSIYEYNEEEHMRMERQDAFADGVEDGFADGFKAGSEQEQANTERERQRADKAEEEIRKLREELEKLKKR